MEKKAQKLPRILAKSPRFCRGISLVELLCVTAVLAILGVIVFSVMRGVRATAMNSQCSANLRSLHNAALIWCHDNEFKLPDVRWWQDNKKTNNPAYPYQLAPYLGLENMDLGLAEYWVGQDSPFKCNASYEIKPSTSRWGRTYGINSLATSSNEGKPRNTIDYPQTLFDIHEPSKMAFFMDGAANPTNEPGSYWSNIQPSNLGEHSAPLQFPHNNTMNVIFIDGHIENISREVMLRDYPEKRSFWYFQ